MSLGSEYQIDEYVDYYAELALAEELQKKNICPKCGKPLMTIEGKKGLYLRCTGYPRCRESWNLE